MSEHGPNHNVSGHQPMLEHVSAVGAARQMKTIMSGLEEVTYPQRKQDRLSNGKKKI